MNDLLIFLPMLESDIDSAVSIYIDYYNHFEGGEWTYKTTHKRIHQVLSREDSMCFLLKLQDEIIGFIMGYFEQYDDISVYNLVEIVLSKAFQGKGIGTNAMRMLEIEVKKSGGAMIQLQAVNDTLHEAFYGKLDYQTCNNLVLKSKWLG